MARDPESNPAAFLGEELRRARLAAGMSNQDQLAVKVHVERSVIGKAETGDRPPTPELAAALDETFPHLDGLFTRLSKLARKAAAGFAPSFGEWIDSEQEATVLRWWEPLVVPGLLQTAEYAREILATNPDITDDMLQERVAGRIERQAILDLDRPPELCVLLGEDVLHRRIGSPKIMYDQLVQLADMSCRSNITVQVVPAELGAHTGLLGAFTIATLQVKPDIVYLETSADGQITEKSTVVSHVTLRFDRLRGEAVPRGASRDLILKVAEDKWNAT
jgi:transcriptional regulator with XRE-family HTH domain